MAHSKKSDPSVVVWEELSQGPETARPFFLVTGKEEQELPWILPRLDNEVLEAQKLEIKNADDAIISIDMTYHPIGDGKVAQHATGLFGAACTNCEYSVEECNDREFVANHWPLNDRKRDMASLNALYFALPKVKKGKNIGKISTKTGTIHLHFHKLNLLLSTSFLCASRSYFFPTTGQ